MRKIRLSFFLALITFTPILNACKEYKAKPTEVAEKTKVAELISFPSSDGLKLTADLYYTNPEDSPFIILFHQAGWSRGEYQEIAPKLVKMGYNCLALDQRSGGEINGVVNETYQRAKKQNLGTKYVDAEIDMVAAIEYVKKNYNKAGKLILWGSSYSSSLIIKITGDRNDIDAVISFTPGEYFENQGKPTDYIAQHSKNIIVPIFITSMKSEKSSWWSIYEGIPAIGKDFFIPETDGQHGSRALWEKFPEHENYWKAVKAFLKTIK